jgi:hypothetical protein
MNSLDPLVRSIIRQRPGLAPEEGQAHQWYPLCSRWSPLGWLVEGGVDDGALGIYIEGPGAVCFSPQTPRIRKHGEQDDLL